MYRFVPFLIAFLYICSLFAQPQVTRAESLDYEIPNGHFYSQAVAPGAQAGYGHSITDSGTDSQGQTINFWSEFKRLGGVAALGYPASERFMLDGFWTQATQRVLLQWRPEVKAAVFVNVFDTLHDIGRDAQLLAGKQVPLQVNDNGSCAGGDFNCIKTYRLGWMEAAPAIMHFYYISNPDPVTYYGLPTSRIDTSNAAFDIMRFQRIVVQYWKVAVPGIATPGMITVGLGGDIAKEQGLVPAAVGAPIPGPAQIPLPPSSELGGKVVFGSELQTSGSAYAVSGLKNVFQAGEPVAYIAYFRQPAGPSSINLTIIYTSPLGEQDVQATKVDVTSTDPTVDYIYGTISRGSTALLKPGFYLIKYNRLDGFALAEGTFTITVSR